MQGSFPQKQNNFLTKKVKRKIKNMKKTATDKPVVLKICADALILLITKKIK